MLLLGVYGLDLLDFLCFVKALRASTCLELLSHLSFTTTWRSTLHDGHKLQIATLSSSRVSTALTLNSSLRRRLGLLLSLNVSTKTDSYLPGLLVVTLSWISHLCSRLNCWCWRRCDISLSSDTDLHWCTVIRWYTSGWCSCCSNRINLANDRRASVAAFVLINNLSARIEIVDRLRVLLVWRCSCSCLTCRSCRGAGWLTLSHLWLRS